MGDKVALGPLCRELVPEYTRWMNDFNVSRMLGRRLVPLTVEAEEAWFASINTSTNAMFTIYETQSGMAIGNCGLHRIDDSRRSAEFGIVIGRKDFWGLGMGTEATQLVLGYGFRALNLHSIFLKVYSNNERGLRAYSKAGFRTAGKLREAHWVAGHPCDIILMDCLATEFDASAFQAAMERTSGL